MTPPRATSQAARNPHGSNVAAANPTGTSEKQSSPPGPPIAASSPVRQRPTGTIPKHKTGTSNIQEERFRQHCRYSGGRSTTARSVDRRFTTTYSGSQPHQPYMGHIQETSAGPRDRWGNRVDHPPQQHHRRAGAGPGQASRQGRMAGSRGSLVFLLPFGIYKPPEDLTGPLKSQNSTFL